MSSLEDLIFADPVLHEQFCAVAEVLSLFVAESSAVIGHTQLKRDTKRCAIEVRQICADLSAAGLLRKQSGRSERWSLAKDASEITLEDVYDCVLNAAAALEVTVDKLQKRRTQLGSVVGRIEIMVMQAAMGISQNNRRHLRHFHLVRLHRDPLQ